MKLQKSFKMALNMVLHSKLRSWLTIIGIVLGVASVVAILAIGDGLEAEINSQFEDTGGDILTLTAGVSKAKFGPGSHRGNNGDSSSASSEEEIITRKDYQTLKGLVDVIALNPKISGSVDIYYQGEDGTASITGTDPAEYSKFSTTDLLAGRELISSDSNVIIIGEKLSTEYFEREISLNQILIIEGKAFRVIGILDGGGTSIIMPIDTTYSLLEDKIKNEYDSIQIKIKDESKLDETITLIEKKLMMTRHVDKKTKDFTISSNAALAEMRQELVSTMTSFLAAIAGVSLLVGAVGVANTMFTSVLEKTKEIGIMKSIGARNKDILTIFLFNSGLIGFVGGLIGAILGYIMIQILSFAGMPVVLTITNISLVVSISIIIGMISGLIPAINASKLSPVDALRSE